MTLGLAEIFLTVEHVEKALEDSLSRNVKALRESTRARCEVIYDFPEGIFLQEVAQCSGECRSLIDTIWNTSRSRIEQRVVRKYSGVSIGTKKSANNTKAVIQIRIHSLIPWYHRLKGLFYCCCLS